MKYYLYLHNRYRTLIPHKKVFETDYWIRGSFPFCGGYGWGGDFIYTKTHDDRYTFYNEDKYIKDNLYYKKLEKKGFLRNKYSYQKVFQE